MFRRLSPRAYLDRITKKIRAERPDYVEPLFTIDEIDAAVGALPELERAVLLNHRKGRLSYRTIARRLGITVGEVERIMSRAYAQLVWEFREIERKREQ